MNSDSICVWKIKKKTSGISLDTIFFTVQLRIES